MQLLKDERDVSACCCQDRITAGGILPPQTFISCCAATVASN